MESIAGDLSDLELLVGTFEKLDLLCVFLLIHLTLFDGRSLRLLELQLQFVQLVCSYCPAPSPAPAASDIALRA